MLNISKFLLNLIRSIILFFDLIRLNRKQNGTHTYLLHMYKYCIAYMQNNKTHGKVYNTYIIYFN